MRKKFNRQLLFRAARLFVIPIAIIFVGDSCKKHGFGSVEGNVIDEFTNEPVPNAEVTICREYHASDCDFLKQTITNQNGSFKIKYRNALNSTYDLTVKSSDSFSEERINDIEGRKSEFTIKLAMKAFAKIRVTNNNNFQINVIAKTSIPSQQAAQSISANQTKTLDQLIDIKVGHSTILYFTIRDNSNTVIFNVDTTILMTKKLDTLLYSKTL